MINRKLMQKAFDLLCDAVEPTATQIQADIGMCAQWDVDAIECIDALRQALAQNPLDVADRAYFAGKQAGITEALAQPEPFSLVCTKCSADRTKEACKGDLRNCELMGYAQSAQPEQDAVAWFVTTKNVEQKVCGVFNSQEEAMLWSAKHLKIGVIKPLYTAPPSKPWVSLTDDDRIEIFNSMDGGIYGFLKTWGWLNFSKALEAKLKELNHG